MELVLSCVGRQSYTFGVVVEMKRFFIPCLRCRWESRLCIRGESETSDFLVLERMCLLLRCHAGWFRRAVCSCILRTRLGLRYTCSIHRFVVPEEGFPVFRGFVGKRDSGDLGDGIWFSVQVQSGYSSFETLAEVHVGKYEWKPIEADLSRWRGREIVMKLVSDVGPKTIRQQTGRAGATCAWKAGSTIGSLAGYKECLVQDGTPEDFVADLPLSVLSARGAVGFATRAGIQQFAEHYEPWRLERNPIWLASCIQWLRRSEEHLVA